MKTRAFGTDGPKVSEIGLGCWQLGADWGPVNDPTADAILDTALMEGVTFYDTADVYGSGLSEKRLAEFRKRSDRDLFIATKCGRGGDPGWPENFRADVVRRHVEGSLARLDVDRLDLVQLHCIPFEELKRGEAFEALGDLKREGKIARFGASVESIEEGMFCLGVDGLSSLQIIFNILRPQPSDRLLPAARAKGVAIIVRLPLASGLLSGKMSKGTQFDPSDHRNYNRDGAAFNVGETFAGLPFEQGLAAVEEIRPLVPEGMTMAQMAIRWLLDFPEVTVVIPGATKVVQAQSNATPSELPPLGEELHHSLREIADRAAIPYMRGPV